jgi:hypothetical protein
MNNKVGSLKPRLTDEPLLRLSAGLMLGIISALYFSVPKQKDDSHAGQAGVAWSWGILIFLSLLCILAFPPFLTGFLRHKLPPSFVSSHRPALKEWLDYSRIVLEISFAVTVSGSVFGEFIRLNVRNGLSSFYTDQVKAFNERVERQKLNLRLATLEYVAGLCRLGRTHASWRLFFRRLGRQVSFYFVLLWKTISAAQTLLIRLLWFGIWFSVGSFPAGLFGFASFVLFVLITCDKILKLYVDNVPS